MMRAVWAAIGIAMMASLTACSASEDEGGDGGSSGGEITGTSGKANSGGEITESSGKAFIKEMRKSVRGAAAYDDDVILNMAENVCALGNVDLGVQVLDNYSQIEAEDRAEVARIALDTACP